MWDSRWEKVLWVFFILAVTLSMLLLAANIALDIYTEWPKASEVQHVSE